MFMVAAKVKHFSQVAVDSLPSLMVVAAGAVGALVVL
jgi:hypothetical protein